MKLIGWILLGLAVVLVGIQLFPFERTNPPVTGDIQVSPQLHDVLRRACYDCHSNETKWPWYTRVAPVSWFVINHVEEGREHLNFSTWTSYNPAKQMKLRKKSWEDVNEGEMPLTTYVWQHSEAKLTDQDKALIRQWGDIALPASAATEKIDDED